MLLFVLALASMPVPIGAPLPGDLGAYGALVGETRAASTRIDLTVDTSGAPVRCDVARSDGSRALDRVACEMLMRRSHFSPARDAAGTSVMAVVRQDFTVNRIGGVRRWGGPAETARQIDFALPVATMPDRGAMPVADLLLMTDAYGRVTDCSIATSTAHPRLDEVACSQLRMTIFKPALDRNGQAQPALRQVSVGFVVGSIPR